MHADSRVATARLCSQSLSVASMHQSNCFHQMTINESYFAAGGSCLWRGFDGVLCTGRELRVEVVGNILWGPDSYGNWLVSA